ncbi:MAG TPA: T9SS type A sorting domain-containing protein [Ignavibacteria bacterium]|nr:T9SS type A sorting domain-containing protein [Ignavibacteria bacterium]HQY53539.1 T9SS type A sorting domain-containing protein [Ignavibacteria bacterium]HRB00582.1 T9SS type A sorting domain-containing protein [Ignavibacteria bacterium]
MTGRAVSVILPHDYQWYVDYSGNKIAKINRDTYDALNGTGINLDWQLFDKWTYDSLGNFTFAADGRVDMLLKVHRHDPNKLLHPTAGGYIPLGACEGADWNNEYTVYQSGSTAVKINGNTGGNGSGGVVCPKGSITDREFYLAVTTHEMGHYLWGHGHHQYCKMAGGMGGEFGLSPWEVVKLEYIEQQIVNYTNPNYYLSDYMSRGGTSGTEGEILQVPINESGSQFFLLANRGNLSEWDKKMGGDTVAGYFLKDINEDYGKGVYIYHVIGGYSEPSGNEQEIDLECADGLWDWTQQGTSSPLWNQTIIHPVFVKTDVKYDQDNPAIYDHIGKDGMSAWVTGIVNGNNYTQGPWYSEGKSHTYSPLNHGTDRVYTNDKDFWYSYQVAGDRYDPWNIGYNELFSPYSSPNSKDSANQYTGIYIWMYSSSGSGPTSSAAFKIFKAGEGGYTDSSILQITPPSRPMGLNVMPCDSQPTINYYKRIKLKWNHNMEPDMERILIGEEGLFKRYKIYRSTASDMGSVPPDALQNSENYYTCIDTIDILNSSEPEYIDAQLVSICNTSACEAPNFCIEYPVRYRVQAVDKYEDVSVLSDFVSTRAGSLEIGPRGNFNLSETENELPSEYSLRQNYPNPFNPSTNIQYDLPADNFVTIKIYNTLGKEVLNLVNEFKNAGRYIVSFRGAGLSSGVYYYRIKAGSFEQIRKMILLK